MMNARLPNGIEWRSLATEFRTGAGRKLEGYAAVFGVPAKIGGFTETVRAGAFSGTLGADKDVLALVDHDPSKLLARTASGTLRLSQDARGLAFSLDLADTQLARDVLAMAERRDLGGMSFGFRVPAGGDVWPAADRRELRTVDLCEISVIHAVPAYAQTTVSARSHDHRCCGTTARLRRLVECIG